MKRMYDFVLISKLDMLGSHGRAIKLLNNIAIPSIIILSALGMILNYVFRMRGEAGGLYFVCCFLSCFSCAAYIYFHEFTHALAIILIKGQAPHIAFKKLVASCGSNTIVFSKPEYFFVASAPLLLFCAVLIPLCVLLPPTFLPLAFSPLCYNIFGSLGDVYMIARALRMPKHSAIIDKGTEILLFSPVSV